MTVTAPSELAELAGLNFVGGADFGLAGMLSPAHVRSLPFDALRVSCCIDLPELTGADRGATAADAAGVPAATLTPRTTVI